jgi:hypothetical protein
LRARAFLWILLGLLLALGLFSWSVQVPLYLKGSGLVLNKVQGARLQGDMQSGGGEVREESLAVVFLPSGLAQSLHIGLPVRIQLGSKGPYLLSSISQIEPGVISPYSACRSYGVDANCSHFISQPSVVAMAWLGSALPVTLYAGSTLTAEVEVGKQRLLPLLLGGKRLQGEE